jgi:hypothetical protein
MHENTTFSRYIIKSTSQNNSSYEQTQEKTKSVQSSEAC